MTLRLPRQLWDTWKPPPQFRFGTVTSVSTGICTVQVAGGEIPVIYFKDAAPSVGDFVSVQRQSVVSYLMTAPVAGALWIGDNGGFGNGGAVWRIPTSGQNPVAYAPWYDESVNGVVYGPGKWIWATGTSLPGVWSLYASGSDRGEAVQPVTLPGSYALGVTAGPDGNVWVADNHGGVWRVTPGFVATYFILLNAYPYGICAGANDNVWVTDQSEPIQSVWSVTMSGASTKFPLDNLATAAGVALGADGNAWVADEYGRVWRVTASGGTSAYAVGSSPVAITSGPDKSLWVLDAINAVWQVSTDGEVLSEIPLPGGSAAEGSWTGITEGQDGNLWVAQSLPGSGGYAVKVTPGGDVTSYLLASDASPSSICTGP